MTIGQKIRKLRNEAGLTQRELGKLSTTSETTIKQYELEKRQPRIEQLEKIAEALGVTVSALIETQEFDGSIRIKPSPEQIEIIRLRDKLLSDRESVTPEELEKLKEYLDPENVKIQMERIIQSFHEAFNALAYGRIQAACEELNEAGQEKVAEHAEMVAKIPEYQKNPDTPPEE